MRLSPSKIVCYDDCPRKFKYRYVDRLEPVKRPANLAFGTAVHSAFQQVAEEQVGESFSLTSAATAFEIAFDEEIEGGTDKDNVELEILRAGGIRLVNEMKREWPEYRLTPVVHDGKPLIEWGASVPLGSRDELVIRLDLVAYNEEGEICLIDAKTTASLSKQPYGPMDQDTAYIIGVEFVTGLAVEQAGYLELRKNRSKNPKKETQWTNLLLHPRQADEVIEEFIEKWKGLADDIRRERFPKTPRQPHNSPCALCEFRDLCWNNDASGLIQKESR